MDDLVKALLAALDGGDVRVEITFKITRDGVQKTGHFGACDVCVWSVLYKSAASAKKGLLTKRQHCTRRDCPKHTSQPPHGLSWLDGAKE